MDAKFLTELLTVLKKLCGICDTYNDNTQDTL